LAFVKQVTKKAEKLGLVGKETLAAPKEDAKPAAVDSKPAAVPASVLIPLVSVDQSDIQSVLSAASAKKVLPSTMSDSLKMSNATNISVYYSVLGHSSFGIHHCSHFTSFQMSSPSTWKTQSCIIHFLCLKQQD
jgi:hypothetical protein